MSYAARSDVIPALMSERDATVASRHGDESATTVDETVVTATLAEADTEINTLIGVRYELPLTETPAVLTQIAARIVRYRLWTKGGMEPAPWITKDYEAAIRTLEQIGKGTASLGLTAAAEDPGASTLTGARVRVGSQAPKFGRVGLKGY